LDLRGTKWREAGEDFVMRSFFIGTFRLSLSDKIKEVKIDETYSTHGRLENVLKKRDYFGKLGVDWLVILNGS
jgi:hypothetical protein